MSLFLGQILTFLTTPPGNLIYHIVLVFSIAGALFGAVHSLLSNNSPHERRTVIGLGIMLGLQLVLFAMSGLTRQGWLTSQKVFPPLDRAVTLLTLVWISWLWAFPEPSHMADVATLLLNLLGITVFGLTLAFWAQKPTSSFNLSRYETGWQIFSLAVILLGILGLVLRKPKGWSYGLAMLILGFLGHFFTLVYPMNGNFPVIVRLTQLAMFPLLPTLNQRSLLPTQNASSLSSPIRADGQRTAALDIERDQSVKEAHLAKQQATEAKKKYEQMLIELEKHPAAPVATEHMELINPISQELRQHTSSIIGYTDLLMGDSVGSLGALQRKFVERIKASIERIDGLVDNLIQITNLDAGKMKFKPEPIDLNLIVDNAMVSTSAQIREKNITLRLDLAGTTPRIQTDRDALQQILIHLLQNATVATKTEGNIALRLKMQDDGDNHFLSIQVTDDGGGIASEDLPRVFARRYQAEHSLIQGLGDTGVGLSITKALVEAQNGRIWVETEAGVGSTFNVLMPVVVESPSENQP
ncbi:MAG: HAMP domain-containing sensor histidine kinase [Anaerolineales bacterium]|jgi:signal transduction histidine kinase